MPRLYTDQQRIAEDSLSPQMVCREGQARYIGARRTGATCGSCPGDSTLLPDDPFRLGRMVM